MASFSPLFLSYFQSFDYHYRSGTAWKCTCTLFVNLISASIFKLFAPFTYFSWYYCIRPVKSDNFTINDCTTSSFILVYSFLNLDFRVHVQQSSHFGPSLDTYVGPTQITYFLREMLSNIHIWQMNSLSLQ